MQGKKVLETRMSIRHRRDKTFRQKQVDTSANFLEDDEGLGLNLMRNLITGN